MVLGKITLNKPWLWAAYGKHPVAMDFFLVGQDYPIAESFSVWVKEGYEKLLSVKKVSKSHFSWRFWARGTMKESLVCGLLKDSCDSIGRPFPLLIMGTGHLKDWEEAWELMPFACEQTWEQCEFISTKTFSNLKIMETELNNIKPPYPGWPEFKIRKDDITLAFTPELSCLEDTASGLSENVILIEQKYHDDQFARISYLHFLLKSRFNIMPNAFFLGGTPENTFLVFFQRPLTRADFIQLWSINSGGME